MSFDNTTVSTTQSSIIAKLELIESRFISQLPIVFLIFGTIGFIGDAFTFLQPTLRKNIFCIFTLCGSIADIMNLYINLLPNYIYVTDNILLIIVGTSSCRWKLFGLVVFHQLSMNFLILSLIDRYSSTCAFTSWIRKIHDLKKVPYLIIVVIIVSSVMSLYSPLLYGYIPGSGCVPTNTLSNGILYICIQGLLTPLIMFIFVCLTFRNIKLSRQRVGMTGNVTLHRPRHQFITTVSTQVIATSFCVLQWMSFYLYHIITFNSQRSAEQWYIHYFIFLILNTLYYLNNVKSFYLTTLTSRLFRETSIKSLSKLIRKISERQQDIIGLPTMTYNNTVRR